MEVVPAPRSALLILSLRQSYLHQNPPDSAFHTGGPGTRTLLRGKIVHKSMRRVTVTPLATSSE